MALARALTNAQAPQALVSAAAYVSMRQHTSAYVSIRQHTSAYVRALTNAQAPKALVSAAAATERQAKVAKGQALLG